MIRTIVAALLFSAALAPAAAQKPAQALAAERPADIAAMAPRLSTFFDEWMKKAHAPGVVVGLVKDGRLLWVDGLGAQDVATKRPVSADSRFRIASMSKAFMALAILKLRDEGRLSLDAPAERYVPEMAGWRYPTADSPRISVADLLHHTAGFVEDNPWGDRQQPMPETEFTEFLKAGVPFANAPGLRMEYSNLGYALLGRIVTNVSGRPYQDYIRTEIMAPIGMRVTSYDVFASPQEERALGFRWQDDGWVREPDMADGVFGAMGGVETTANDYAKWVAFLLSAWPARDGPESVPVKRATLREIVEGANFLDTGMRSAALGPPCRQASAYAKGWDVVDDCTLGRVVTHTGGYPGYGSVVTLLPDAGIGMFAFSNRTYGAPVQPVMQALMAVYEAGFVPKRAIPVSEGLASAYDAAKLAWTAGDATRAPLANNVLMDRTADRRRADIAGLKARVGTCAMAEPVEPVSAMEGRFRWTCASGKIAGRVQLAPTAAPSLQVLNFAEAKPPTP